MHGHTLRIVITAFYLDGQDSGICDMSDSESLIVT